MQKHSTAKGRKGSTSKRDALAPYREQAQTIIRLYFSDAAPAFVRDLLGSWLLQLENETQIFWNVRDVLEVALPLMLQEADRQGLDVFSPRGGFYVHALHDAAGCIEAGDEVRRKPSEREILESALRREAEAFATLIKSNYLPEEVRYRIGCLYDELTDGAHNDPETIRAQYPAALLKMKVAEEGGAGSHG